MRAIAVPLLLLACANPAGAEPLAARTGQWAMTMTLHMDGPLLSPETMAKLPPQAQAQMGAALAQMQQPKTHLSCLTQDKLDHGFDVAGARSHGCAQKIMRQTATELDITGSCDTAGGTMTEHGIITVAGRQTMTGHFDMQRSGGDGPRHMAMQINGKWLSDTCTGGEDDAAH